MSKIAESKKIAPVIPPLVKSDDYLAQEWQKMLDGLPYDAAYSGFLELLKQTRRTVKRYNELDPCSPELREILAGLLGSCGSEVTINQPFRCDYGCNIHVGEKFVANFNLTVLDEALVVIGDNCLLGPNVSIYTACHPLDPVERNKWVEWAEPVTIGNNVWIGGSTTILPGVTIGDNCVIGGGSVVSRDIPPCSLAVGNPARVIRHLNP